MGEGKKVEMSEIAEEKGIVQAENMGNFHIKNSKIICKIGENFQGLFWV